MIHRVTIDHRALMVLKIYTEVYTALMNGDSVKIPSQREVVEIIKQDGLDMPQKLRKNNPIGSGTSARTKIVRAESKLKDAGLIERRGNTPVVVSVIGRRVIKAMADAQPDATRWPNYIVVEPGFDCTLYHLKPNDPAVIPLESPAILPVFNNGGEDEEE